jgi:hypothetical protein
LLGCRVGILHARVAPGYGQRHDYEQGQYEQSLAHGKNSTFIGKDDETGGKALRLYPILTAIISNTGAMFYEAMLLASHTNLSYGHVAYDMENGPSVEHLGLPCIKRHGFCTD